MEFSPFSTVPAIADLTTIDVAKYTNDRRLRLRETQKQIVQDDETVAQRQSFEMQSSSWASLETPA
jgi:hypothetical protein